MSAASTLESRYFNHSGGIPIHYQAGGHGPVALVFLHGFASAHDTWHDLAGHFSADRFKIFLVDLKGFGLSAKPRDGAYTVGDQVAMVHALIRELGLRSLILIGHSLGGAVALRLCLQIREGVQPFEVERLVLIGCAAYPQKLPKFFRRLKSPWLGPLLLRLIPSRKMAQATLEKVYFDQSAVTPARISRYARYFRGRGTSYALRATVKRIDPAEYEGMGEEYAKLTLPTMIIWGEADRIVKLKNGLRLHGDIAGSQLKLLERCGHTPHEERTQDTFAAIEPFFAAHDSRGK